MLNVFSKQPLADIDFACFRKNKFILTWLLVAENLERQVLFKTPHKQKDMNPVKFYYRSLPFYSQI